MTMDVIRGLVAFLVIHLVHGFQDSQYMQECQYPIKNDKDAPEVFFLNLHHRRDRRQAVQGILTHMNLDFQRVEALTPKDLYIPPDLLKVYKSGACIYQTAWRPYPNNDVKTKAYFASLCGKPTRAHEIATTASHILAIYNACHSKSSSSRYALIMEDDVFIPFDIQWKFLYASAPEGWGILQLYSMHFTKNTQNWNRYKRNPKDLWSKEKLWSAGAYLIDKEVMKPVISKLLAGYNGWWQFRVLANAQTCNPKECCVPGTNKLNTRNTPPCVPADVPADYFVFGLAPSYSLRPPIAYLRDAASRSDIQGKNETQTGPSEQGKLYINEMISGAVPFPPFARYACNGYLKIDQTVLDKQVSLQHVYQINALRKIAKKKGLWLKPYLKEIGQPMPDLQKKLKNTRQQQSYYMNQNNRNHSSITRKQASIFANRNKNLAIVKFDHGVGNESSSDSIKPVAKKRKRTRIGSIG